MEIMIEVILLGCRSVGEMRMGHIGAQLFHWAMKYLSLFQLLSYFCSLLKTP